MTRHTYAAAESAAAASDLQYRLLVDMGVTSSTLYMCTGNKYIYTMNNTYSPVGAFGGIDPIDDNADVLPRTLRFWLQAVGSADIFEAMREDMFNRPVVVRRAFLNTNDSSLVSTPDQQWRGFINKVDIHFNDEERGNFYEVEAETALRRKAEATNFNKETHWTVLGQSGDLFFSYIYQVPLAKALWGNQPTTHSAPRLNPRLNPNRFPRDG